MSDKDLRYEPGALPSSFDGDEQFYSENRWSNLTRKLKAEPLVPLGALATCYALYRAQRAIKAGDRELTNRMFRARILAQGFTLLAIAAGGLYFQKEKQREKEIVGLVKEKKEKEKRDRWLKELEIRDEEDKRYKSSGKMSTVHGAAISSSATAGGGVDQDVSQATKPLSKSDGKLLEAVKELERGRRER